MALRQIERTIERAEVKAPVPHIVTGDPCSDRRCRPGRSARCAIIVVVLLGCAPLLQADETPRTGVIDDAGVIRPETIRNINAWLLELEQKTGAQLKVWTVDSTNGRDPYSLAMETAKKWKLGQKGKDNGCLVLIAVKDRKWRIVSGEGIEDSIPDLYCDTVAQQYFVPYFRKGNYSQGILMGTAALAKAIAKDAGVELTGMPNTNVRSRRGRGSGGGAVASCFSLLIMIIIFGTIFRGGRGRGRRRYGWGGGDLVTGMILGNVLGNLSGGRRSGWSGGSSWGGGGGFGGGFGGGGGGSFGGGGAGGGW